MALKEFNGGEVNEGTFTWVRARLGEQHGMVRCPGSRRQSLAPEARRSKGGNSLVRAKIMEGGPFAENVATFREMKGVPADWVAGRRHRKLGEISYMFFHSKYTLKTWYLGLGHFE